MIGAEEKRVAQVLCGLCDAFNARDPERAARLFVCPVLFRTGGETDSRDDEAALVAGFEAHLGDHRRSGVAGYRIKIGDAVVRGGEAHIAAVWTHRLAGGGDGPSTGLGYVLRRTADGWRIAAVEAGADR